jgi:spermidine/putrescine transport system permease protein
MFAIPEILGGTGDILIGNLIKEQFLGTRDWPFGSTLSIMLTVAVLAFAGLAAWFARRGLGRHA